MVCIEKSRLVIITSKRPQIENEINMLRLFITDKIESLRIELRYVVGNRHFDSIVKTGIFRFFLNSLNRCIG